MNNLERLYNNMIMFYKLDDETYTKIVFESFLENGKKVNSIDELNELLETEMSYWEE